MKNINDCSNKLVDSYLNDGFIYCILTGLSHNGNKIVKIGKTSMKIQDDETQVYKKLLTRYGTYYPDYSVVHFKRTGNCHSAEKLVFKKLKKLHYTKELYFFDESKIELVFGKVINRYECLEELLNKYSDTEVLNKANRILKNKIKLL